MRVSGERVSGREKTLRNDVKICGCDGVGGCGDAGMGMQRYGCVEIRGLDAGGSRGGISGARVGAAK